MIWRFDNLVMDQSEFFNRKGAKTQRKMYEIIANSQWLTASSS